MARLRREQREELQQARQSHPQEQAKSQEQTSPLVQTKWQEQLGQEQLGQERSGLQAAARPGERAFSTDPSPFSQRPALSPDSSAYRELVAIAAYYRAERRGFAPGGEVEDWLAAEREVASGVGEVRAM